MFVWGVLGAFFYFGGCFFFCFVLGRVACFFVSFLGDRFLCISFTEKSILKYIKNKYRKRMQKGPAGKVQEKESKEVLG